MRAMLRGKMKSSEYLLRGEVTGQDPKTQPPPDTPVLDEGEMA